VTVVSSLTETTSKFREQSRSHRGRGGDKQASFGQERRRNAAMAKQTSVASAEQARALRDVVRANEQLALSAKQVAIGAATGSRGQ